MPCKHSVEVLSYDPFKCNQLVSCWQRTGANRTLPPDYRGKGGGIK